MHASQPLPELALARVLTGGGPYRPGDEISVAFTVEGVGRLVAHDAAVRAACVPLERALVPDMISVVVTHPALVYDAGDVLTLSFVDPQVARIHCGGERSGPSNVKPQVAGADLAPVSEARPVSCQLTEPRLEAAAPAAFTETPASAAEVFAPEQSRTIDGTRAAGVLVRLNWNGDRLRRFIQVVDKLFTIDRLGWYRHALAMRLLIPDEIHCGHPAADSDANRYLQALRGAAIAALGKPLLAACMPNFVVTSEWLETMESAGEARAIAGLRDALLPYVEDDAAPPVSDPHSAYTVGIIARPELLAPSVTSVEAFLPVLIPTVSHEPALTHRLCEYRHLLIDLFGQTARAGEIVRLNQMAQPNHSLDDRLWQLVGAASEAFEGFTLA